MADQSTQSDTAPQHRSDFLLLWIARVVVLLAGLAALWWCAALRDDSSLILVICVYTLAFGTTFNKSLLPFSYGFQLGIGIVAVGASMWVVFLFFLAWGELNIALGNLLIAMLLNLGMVGTSAVYGHLSLSNDKRAQRKLGFGWLLGLMSLIAYLFARFFVK